MYPPYFKNQIEYDSYKECFRKLSLGDRVHIYAGADRSLTLLRSRSTIGADIIGIYPTHIHQKSILVGVKQFPPSRFWTLGSLIITHYPDLKTIINFHEFRFGYWISDDNVLIKQIIKANNVKNNL